MATKTKQQEVTFIARCKNLVLTLEPAVSVARGPGGIVLHQGDAGRHVEFENGLFKTSDGALIEELRGHRLFNLVQANNGFYEEGNSPDEPKPTVKKQLAALARASAKRDIEAIRAVIEEEKATHKRPIVLDTAQEYVEALGTEIADGDSKEKKPSRSRSTASAAA